MSGRVANIGARGRRRRLLVGVGSLTIGLILDVVLISAGLDSRWFPVLYVPFFFGALGLLQARGAT